MSSLFYRNLRLVFSFLLTFLLVCVIGLSVYLLHFKLLFGVYSYFFSLAFLYLSLLFFKTSRAVKLFISFALVFLPFFGVGLLIYLFVCGLIFGKKNKKVGLYARKRPVLKKNGEGVTEFFTAKEGFSDYLREIENAKNEVLIYSYIIKNDPCLFGLWEALERCLKRGVKVTVGGDYYGSGPFYRNSVFKILKRKGAKINCFRKPSLFLTAKDNVRAHGKVTVIDKKTTYIWTANLEEKSLFEDINYLVKIKNDGLSRDVFAPLFGEKEGEKKVVGSFSYLPILIRSKGEANEVFCRLISSAKEEITIVSPYVSFNKETEGVIKSALFRGVRIKILTPSLNEKGKKDRVSDYFLNVLLSFGVEVFRYEKGFIHQKALVVDGEKILFGSANFDLRSGYFAVESMVVSLDNRLIARFLKNFEEIKKESRRTKYENSEGAFSFREKFFEFLGPLV